MNNLFCNLLICFCELVFCILLMVDGEQNQKPMEVVEPNQTSSAGEEKPMEERVPGKNAESASEEKEPNMQKEKEPNMKKVKEPSVTIRCSLASLHDFVNLLTPGAKAKVIEIGFQNILKLPSIRNPLKVTETLMDRARVTDEGRILLPIKDEVDLILEPEDVSLILGIGMAGGQSKELPQANDQSSNVLDKMYSLLKYASDKHGTKKHPKPVQSKDKDDELVQGQVSGT